MFVALVADIDRSDAHVVAFAAVLRAWIDGMGIIGAFAARVSFDDFVAHDRQRSGFNWC